MKLNKYITFISTLFFCWTGTIGHAEQINFNGAVSEFTCTQQSQDQSCLDLQKILSKVDTLDNPNELLLLQKQKTQLANFSIENTENQYRKVLVVHYN